MRVRTAACIAVAALLASVAGGDATGARGFDPGVTATSIKIGGTYPFTGLASSLGVLGQAEAAYFANVNDHGGVNGRMIDFEELDDANDPSQTVLKTQQLVEQDHVFAVYGSVGVPGPLAVRDYLNQRKVPQVLIASPANYWGYQHKAYPWTIGLQPDSAGEGRIYGEYIRAHLPGAKIGVLYGNNANSQDLLAGLRAGLGPGDRKLIVAARSYDVSQPDVSQQIIALEGSGADVFVDAGGQPQAPQALVLAAQFGWQRRATFISFIGGPDSAMKAAAGRGASIDGDISAAWTVDPNTPGEANLPGIVLGKQILARYASKLDATNRVPYAGMLSAWTMVYALRHAGNPPTRRGLMAALHSLDPKKAKNPFLYPGVGLKTSSSDNFPVEQQILVRWTGGTSGHWLPFGKLYDHAR